MSHPKLNKLKSVIKNGTEVTLNLSSNLIGSSNDKTNFPHKLLLTNKQVSKIRKAFANGLSATITFSKSQLFKIVQRGGFVGNFLDLLNPYKSPIFHPKKKLKKPLIKQMNYLKKW